MLNQDNIKVNVLKIGLLQFDDDLYFYHTHNIALDSHHIQCFIMENVISPCSSKCIHIKSPNNINVLVCDIVFFAKLRFAFSLTSFCTCVNLFCSFDFV
jgi:hypothetical protein